MTKDPHILYIHGLGANDHEWDYVKERVGYPSTSVLLPGHGTTPEDLRNVTWYDWVRAVENTYNELAKDHRVVLAGMSLGALVGAHIAARKPDNLAGLVMVAPILYMRDIRARTLPKASSLFPKILSEAKLREQMFPVDTESPEAHYTAIPGQAGFEVLSLGETVRNMLPSVQTSTLHIYTVNDPTVLEPKSSDEVKRVLPYVRQLPLAVPYHGHLLKPLAGQEHITNIIAYTMQRFIETLSPERTKRIVPY